jgi:hypothetical protein
MPRVRSTHNQIFEFITPQLILDAVYAVLGEIDLDPLSSDLAQEYVHANHYLTPQDDGFNTESPWEGRVYCFPPTGLWTHDKRTDKFRLAHAYSITCLSGPVLAFQKMLYYYCHGHIRHGLMYANNLELIRMDQRTLDFPVCIPSFRPRLLRYDGETVELKDSEAGVFVYFPDVDKPTESIEEFAKIFDRFGRILA